VAQVQEILVVFLIPLILLLPLLVIINMYLKKPVTSIIKVSLFISYCFVVVSLTLWPPISELPAVSWSDIPYNIKPLDSIIGSLSHSYYVVGLRNVLGNIVLIMPLAFLLNYRHLHRVLLVGFCISLSIEILQVFFTKFGITFARSFDVDDLLLNTIGFFIGSLIRTVLIYLLRKKRTTKPTRATQEGNDIS
jgi:glycopeptide antibiotics resistance protein